MQLFERADELAHQCAAEDVQLTTVVDRDKGDHAGIAEIAIACGFANQEHLSRLFKRACGTRRFIYNWGREHWEAEYQAYKLEQETVPEAERTLKPPNAMGLKKQFNAIREPAGLSVFFLTEKYCVPYNYV